MEKGSTLSRAFILYRMMYWDHLVTRSTSQVNTIQKPIVCVDD